MLPLGKWWQRRSSDLPEVDDVQIKLKNCLYKFLSFSSKLVFYSIYGRRKRNDVSSMFMFVII
jgi:hypothetical protein